MPRPLAIVLVLSALAGCGGSGGSGGSVTPRCSEPAPARDTTAVPSRLRLERHATITDVRSEGRALGITAVSELSVIELYPPLARAILDAGFSIVSSDNEGFEAEIFFGNDTVTGAYRLREAPCKDQVIVRLLFEERKRK